MGSLFNFAMHAYTCAYSNVGVNSNVTKTDLGILLLQTV